TLDEQPLREHLRASLPAYMLPQHFVQLPQLPLLPNGKINRKELPPPATVSTVAEPEGDLPLTATEALLASVWKELLKTAEIRAEDNFFDLGGHSLLAMQSILMMETRTGKRLNPRRMIFETLRQVARAYDEMPAEAPKPAVFSRLFAGLLRSRRR
ncbi:MAG TPA: phosphopantetheine-binding protein, partial [Burkholderiaceae bacterium]|nr:phosphopantetheine-binding protein [Burkholderiaceae bacterium]